MLIKCVYCSRGIRKEPVLSGDRFWHQRCLDKENRREERQARREAADPMIAAERMWEEEAADPMCTGN